MLSHTTFKEDTALVFADGIHLPFSNSESMILSSTVISNTSLQNPIIVSWPLEDFFLRTVSERMKRTNALMARQPAFKLADIASLPRDDPRQLKRDGACYWWFPEFQRKVRNPRR